MLSERAVPICLLRILEEHSDAEHVLPMREIIAKLKTTYDVSVDRRTVYNGIELLMSMGYDICVYAENGKGYYLRERILESSEVRLLTDAVYSCPYITEKQTADLVAKLQSLQSRSQRRQYKHLRPIRSNRKTQNRTVFLNIELLEEAISRRVRVTFIYTEYGLDKELHPRRDKRYVVEPYTMIATNEHYYLVCRTDGHSDTNHYRIDLMRDIVITDVPVLHNEAWRKASENAVYAFSGEPDRIKLRCCNYIVGDVIDRFGANVQIIPDGDSHFFASFTAAPFGLQFWALQYMPHVELLEPQWLRDAVIHSIQSNPYDRIT